MNLVILSSNKKWGVTTWYQSELGLNTLGSWEVVFTTVGVLRMVRTLHIVNMNARTCVLHLCEHGIKFPG